uniref:Uncharacterized protein n=1 Tax=Arundo donax TaxID=35708 RepID=A0A0A9GTC1_ARUDO
MVILLNTIITDNITRPSTSLHLVPLCFQLKKWRLNCSIHKALPG